jgi:hypothetical protein
MIKIDEITEIEIKDGTLTINQFDNNNVILSQYNLNKILAAINYTRCCEELKDKETPTFDKWLKKLKWKQIGSSYTFKRGESYTDAESLLRSYKKEYYNL